MLLQSQETHSILITQFIWYLRSFNRNSLLRQRSLPRMNSCCEQGEANWNSKQIRCHKLPCALPGTRVWGSRVHFSPPRPHSDSAAQHRSARFRSSLWNPWSCGSAHHCRLEKQARTLSLRHLPQWVTAKDLAYILLNQLAADRGWCFKPSCSSHKASGTGSAAEY